MFGYSPYVIPQGVDPASYNFTQNYLSRKTQGSPFEQQQRLNNTQDVAMDVADKSAGNIPVDKYGVVQNTGQVKPDDLTSQFNQQTSAIRQTGTNAADAAQAANQWQQLKKQQDLAASYSVKMGTPVANGYAPATGGSPVGNNKGAQAVQLAMNAYNNKTPYVWGGNSLIKGIDCSGLVQQAYSQLGINLPRTTYEQAKSGSVIGLNSLQPGDLVFYNTGSSDPNGVGQYSHVAIYTGNGNIVDARNTRTGMQSGSIYGPGTPVLGVRPW
jgi:cell wall-associated NlpC family hydrolase